MTEDILEKFNKAKQEAIDNPPKKKRGCASCKKKKNEITELPELEPIEEIVIVFDDEDIVKAYHEVVNRDGIREEAKVFINGVYQQLFNEEFRFDNCISCKNNQYHKLRNYIRYHLKKNV
jgi:hypothetical protein